MAGSAAVYAEPCRGDVELPKERKGDSQEQSKLYANLLQFSGPFLPPFSFPLCFRVIIAFPLTRL